MKFCPTNTLIFCAVFLLTEALFYVSHFSNKNSPGDVNNPRGVFVI
nr:MAG TPA: hypothetical protein [Siphoviridae sp. ctqtA1]